MLISQHPCPCREDGDGYGTQVQAGPRAKGKQQARQTKSKKENRYVIKVMNVKQGREWVPSPLPLPRKNQKIYQAFFFLDYIYIIIRLYL
jgi:hypothetical protein